MKYCTNCGESIDTTVQFCPHCGYDQISTVPNKRASSAILNTLCVLTLIGSVFTILRALIYLTIASGSSKELMMIRGSLYLLSSIGTIIGAVIMLNKKILGLYVYTVSQVIYLITIFFALSYYVSEIGDFLGEEFAILVAMFFVVPSVAILAMYWTQLAKQHLK
jgi:hypothetical protein